MYVKITDSVIKQVPNILENSVLIMESLTVPDRLTLFGEVYDAKNNAVLAVLELNPKDKNGRALSIIKIASAYGKDTNPQGLINKSKILYTNKNRINRWLSVNRLQLPLPSYSTDSKNSISENQNAVKDIIRKNYENSDTTQRKKGVTIKKYKTTIRNSNENGKIGAFTDGKTQADIIEKIAKEYNKRGINVEIIDEAGEQNGWYTPSSNTITVNLSAKNPLEAFLHETGHAIKAYAGEYWEEIKNAAFTYIAQIEDESISELRKGYAELFEAHSRSYTSEAIDEEIVSDAIAAMARDKNSVLQFYNALIQNGAEETLAQKIIRKLKEILMKLKAHFLDFDTIAVEYNSSVTRAVREGNTSKTPFFEYADKISNILSQSFENLNVERNIKTLNIKFSQIDNKPFNVKVDEISKMTSEEVLDNARRGTFISVSEHTPKIILDNVSDAQDLKMIMSFSKLYLDMNKSGVLRGNYHNLGAEEIKKLYDYISNPQAIVKMDNGRLNLLSTLSEGNNNVISIELNTVKDINNRNKKYNLVITVFNSKDNYIKNLINKHGVSVEYIKKDLPQVNSQLYKWLATINDKSTNNTISQNDTVVNSNISENSENDTRKFSLNEDKEKWTPIKPTERTQKVLDRLANNEFIPLDTILTLEEIKEAYTKRGEIEPTININTPSRQELRLKVQDDVEKLGSARLDENGKWVYDNPIRKEKRIDVVIGLPAAGKSSVLVDPLSNAYGSRIVDCDIVKERLPEFNNGYGSDAVHEESKLINDRILQKAIESGENIALPIIGSKYGKLVGRLEEFRSKGYSIHLHLNELSMNKSLGRMINRFFETGRFLKLDLPYDYQNKPTKVFNRIIAERGDLLDGYSHYSNDVRRGEEPIFIKGTEKVQEVTYTRGSIKTSEGAGKDIRGRFINNHTSEQPDDKTDPFCAFLRVV